MSICTETKEFIHKFDDGSSELTVDIVIPLEISTQEFVGRLVASHNIPCYAVEGLLKALNKFVDEETENYYNQDAIQMLDSLRNAVDSDINDVVDKFVSVFQEGHSAFSTPEGVTDEEVFSEAYHSLIHSPALETLLNLEHTYASAVEDTINDKTKEIKKIAEKQAVEMNHSVQGIGVTTTDNDVNTLAANHFEENQMTTSKWESHLSVVKEQQKREYRNWVMTVHEDFQTSTDTNSYLQRVRALSFKHENNADDDSNWSPQPSRMEESFTIHLGAQMKTTQNLRLLAADVLDLCKHHHNIIGGVVVPQPQRLQTAMALYSNNLCGLILLVDDRLNSFSGLKKDFANVCEKSSEFHFLDLENQLDKVRNQVENSIDRSKNDHSSKDVTTTSDSKNGKKKRLKVGDFYITRHSNLAEVHVVFHMVTDDTLLTNNITSRHPVILGLRNLLKVACDKDIYTVTIPLLLVHEMTEEMTIQWCMKRAELVFKCVKGFMIEILSWGGSDTRTIQFLLPKGISEDLFNNIASMLPNIFHISNPLILQTS